MKTEQITKEDALEAFKDAYGMPCDNARVRVIDHTSNPIAPESYCYKITFKQFGKSKRFAFWPNTVGYQAY